MPGLSNLAPVSRRALPIFYVLDTSGSMQGEKIERLNHAMEETVDALKQVAASNSDAQLRIAVLEFSTNVSWVTKNGPEDAEDFAWQDLGSGGMTYMGAALDELNDKLSANAFLSSATGSLMPVIIFMTDGYANDDYPKALARINKNKFFQRAVKIGFAIGADADSNMIAKVVGDKEAVIKTDDLGLFARMIRFVSVTSSVLQSVSQTSATALTGSQVISQVIEEEGIKPTSIGITTMGNSQAKPAGGDDGSLISINVNPGSIVWDNAEEW